MQTREFRKGFLDAIKNKHKFKSKPFRDERGTCIIGYGHTADKGDPDPRKKKSITMAQAKRILIRDLSAVADKVDVYIGDASKTIPSHVLEALYYYAFCVGVDKLKQSYMLEAIEKGKAAEIDKFLEEWCPIRKVVVDSVDEDKQIEEVEEAVSIIKSLNLSKKQWAVVYSVVATIGAKVTEMVEKNTISQEVFLGCIGITALLFVSILIYEVVIRLKRN